MALSITRNPVTRRWYVVLVGLLLTGALGWGAFSAAPTEYTARGLVMLLPSKDLLGARGNPLLNLGGLDLPARVLIAYYGSEPARTEIEAFAPHAEVEVGLDPLTSGPVIAVDVTGPSPAETLSVLDRVVESIPENLRRIQSDVGATGSAAIRSTPLVVDEQAERDYGTAVRLVLAAIAVGVAVTLAAAFALDGILLGRAAAGRVAGPADSEGEEVPVLSEAASGEAGEEAGTGEQASGRREPELHKARE